jgi:hypothetical protein
MAQAQSPTRLEGIIQKMIDANESDEDIQAVIKEFEKQYPDEVKTAVGRAKVEEPMPFVGPEAPPEPPPEKSFAESVLTWPNAVRFGASTLGDLSAPFTFGTGPFIGGAIGEGLGRAMEGQPFDPSIMAVEGGLNYIPGGGRVERAGLKGLLQQGARSARHGAVQGAVGTFPRHQANEGNLFSPTEWTMPSVGEFGSQTVGGAVIGGTVGAGTKAARPVIKAAGRPVAAVGGVMKEHAPITGSIPLISWMRGPKKAEQAVGGWVEGLGERMRVGGRAAQDAAAVEEFWGRNSPDAQDPIIRISSTRVGGARDPILDSPITTPDAEVPELDQFRQSTNRNAWDPEETTVNETTDPILESPIQPISDAEALDPYKNWATGPEYTPPPVTVNEAPLTPFDKYGMMDPDAPEPGAEIPTPEAPPVNVGTGSAFERAMQAKAAAARAAGRDPSLGGDEAPPVDVTGRLIEPPLSFEAPQGLPAVAKGQNISVNPDGDLLWPGVPNAQVIAQVEAQGFKFEPETNTFRKIGLWEKFLSGEEGSFSHEEAFNELRKILGRDPTDDELAKHIAREFRPDEPSDISQLRQQNVMQGPVQGPIQEGTGNTDIDPNEIWNNLWRLNNGEAPTDQQLMDALGREGFKPGQRIEEVKNEIANRGWTDQIRNAISGRESPVWQEILAKLNEDAKKPRVESPRNMADAVDELAERLEHGNWPGGTDNLKTEIIQFMDDVIDIETAQRMRDDLGTIIGNAESPATKATFEELYKLADQKYRRLRNPGLESPRPNQAKPIEDAFGPKAEIPPIDKWDTGPIKPPDGPQIEVRPKDRLSSRGFNNAWDIYVDGQLYEGGFSSKEAAERGVENLRREYDPEYKTPKDLEWMEDIKEMDIDELNRRRDILENREDYDNPDVGASIKAIDAELAKRDRTPSKLPGGHVDIEGNRFVDLNQNIQRTKPGDKPSELPADSRLNDMVKYKADWVNEVLSGLDKLRQSYDIGLDNALTRLKTDLKIKNPSRAQISEIISNLNKLAKHPDSPKDTWLDLKDNGGITEEDFNNYFKKKGGDEPPEDDKSKVWVPKKK